MAQLFIENLTVIDFSYACPERGIVGASWIVDIVLHGGLDEQGMVFDFGDVKKSVKQFIDDEFDHKLWLNKQLPYLSLDTDNVQLTAQWNNNKGQAYLHESPCDAVIMLDTGNIDTNTIAPVVAERIKTILPSNVTGVDIVLREEVINGAQYCYTHGLQKHLGNCQRIAHGHRSRIEVLVDGKRSEELEAYWAKEWKDVYLASESHIVRRSEDHTQLKYEAQQGHFRLRLPNEHVFVFDIVSTVENIASFLAEETKKIKPNCAIQVKAFEGIGKGAIASA